MLFSYVAVDQTSVQREGTVEAPSVDAAITAVQKRGYTLVSIDEVSAKSGIFDIEIDLFGRVSNKDVVILSRQISTLFQAQVSPLRIFSLLSAEVENKKLATAMNKIVEDLQAGNSISRSLAVHPEIFSSFYVNLIKAGEESGSLDKSFDYLADYLDRQYEIQSKAKNALIYPAFVIGIFVIVMTLMMTQVIPSIATILIDSGQELPIYTQIVINISDFLANYIGYIVLALGAGAAFFWRFSQTPVGRRTIDEFQLSLPYFGDLQRKLLLTRICDNLSTMLGSGISMVQAIEVTGDVVDNTVFKEIMSEVLIEVKGGRSFAESIAEYPQIPGVLAQMAKVGEETGSLANILKTLSDFYRREANNAIDTMISLIEPIMIVLLGLGVGTLLASVLMPIYNLTSGF
jgi:type IV pilus assembly protein PilC